MFCYAFAFAADTPELARARKLYLAADFEGVINQLAPVATKTAADWQLIGQSWFGRTEFKKSSDALEQAVAAAPADATAWLWLGRAYGRRAETSSMFTAPGLANKCRQAFEKSVELNPRSREALNDLFDYYLQAPGFLGGGEEKAQSLIDKIASLDPAERHFAEARLAESRKEYSRAESQLRRAMELAPTQIGRAIDLAKFLARRGRITESEVTFAQAEKINPNDPTLLFERAATYIDGKRNLTTAKALLERYLNSPLTPDNPSRDEARRLLSKVGG
ncbi:MAG: hypothetical protein NTV70_10030 [Acidobacteria bacterium]|nr:hypothetical protein [Acidobacteriota bacterium]